MDGLTDRQQEILDFINQFRESNQCNPTMREIADNFGMASANAAHDHLIGMQKKGAVEIIRNKSRGYIVTREYM